MAITAVGTPSWGSSWTAPSWPAGASAGDVAFLFTEIKIKSAWTDGPDVTIPSGWSGWVSQTADTGSNTYKWRVARQVIPAGGPVALPTPTTYNSSDNYKIDYLDQMLLVLTGAAGFDTSVRGNAYVQVAAGGAAVCVTAPKSGLYSATSGVTDLPANGGPFEAIWDTNDGGSAAYIGWNDADSEFNVQSWAIEVLPRAAPDKPTITAPAQSAGVPTGEDVPVTFVHNTGVAGGSQKAYTLRVRQDGGTWYYWNATAGTLTSTTSVTNTSTSGSVTLPSAAITGASIELIVKTQEAVDNQWSPNSDTRTFSRVPPPSVVVTGPGALTGDLSPTVTWVTTVGIGSQQTYRVVFTDPSDNVLHDSGTLTGTAETYTAPATTEWTSGQTVTATVTITQTGGAEADDSDTFSISWTAPTTPTVAATAATQGVKVTVSADADRILRVWRRDGSTDTLLGVWETGDDDTLELVDVFGPTTAVTYVAQVWSDLDGTLLPSTQGVSSSVTRTDGATTFYLASGLDPVQTWQAVEIREEGDRTHVRPVATVWPVGTVHSRTLSGEPRGQVGAFTAHATTGVDLDDLVDLLESGETLLCWFPPEPYSGGTTGGYTLPMAVTSEVGESRLAQVPYALRILSWSWAERSHPMATSSSVAPVTSAVVLSTAV